MKKVSLLTLLIFSLSISCSKDGDFTLSNSLTSEEKRVVLEKKDAFFDLVNPIIEKYQFGDFKIQFLVENVTDRLARATPLIFENGAVIHLNKVIFLNDTLHSTSDSESNLYNEAIEGLVAHELAHALHYKYMKTGDLIKLGISYAQFTINPNGNARPFIKQYEQFTDLNAIALGYGKQLIDKKEASEKTFDSKNFLTTHIGIYLNPKEINNFINKKKVLKKALDQRFLALRLPSLKNSFLNLPKPFNKIPEFPQ